MIKYTRVIYVVFTRVPKRIWSTFLNKKMNHCYFITPIDDHKTLMINQTAGGSEINVYPATLHELAKNVIDTGAVDIMRWVTTEKELGNNKMRFFRTCVGSCKDAMGIAKPGITTPKQLYKYMSKNLKEKKNHE